MKLRFAGSQSVSQKILRELSQHGMSRPKLVGRGAQVAFLDVAFTWT